MSPRPSALRVWILNLVLACAAALLWVHLRGVPAPEASVRLPWWGLAAGFAVTEACVVHIHFRHGAHSFTLGEIPLVLGLFFAAPADVVAAWMLGTAIVLGLQGRQPALRAVFNVAQIGATAGLAGEVFRLLGGSDVELGPRAWGAAAVAALVAATAAALLVVVAMALSGERVRGRRLSEIVITAALMAPTNASLALAAASVLDADPLATPLLLAPAAVIFVAYRAYTAERAKHTTLEFLHEATRTLTLAGGADSGLAGMLAMVCETFRAASGEVCLFPTPDRESGTRVTLDAAADVSVDERVDSELADALHALVDGHPGVRVVVAAEVEGPVAAHLRLLGLERAMVATLSGERRLMGVLIVADRAGASLGRDELRLLDLLAHHVGATLEQDRLGRKVSMLAELSTELEHKAFHDPLTGLANRLLFMDRVAHSLSRRTGTVGLLYIDLDDFKSINDTLGHDAGDELLRETARRLRATLRTADTPARLGGDEFAIMVLDIDEATARVVAERILTALREPFALAGRTLSVHASLGVALAASGTVGADDLVRNADVAMYTSKHGGKRNFSVYRREMETAR